MREVEGEGTEVEGRGGEVGREGEGWREGERTGEGRGSVPAGKFFHLHPWA